MSAERSTDDIGRISRINRVLFVALCVLVVLGAAIVVWSTLPRTAEDWNERGEMLAQRNKYDKALECFERAIELDPESTVYHGNRGNVRLYLGDFSGAVEDFTFVIDENPHAGAAYYNRGVAYSRLDLFTEALTDLNRACDLGIERGCDAVEDIKEHL